MIILTSSVIIAVLLVLILVLLTGRYFKTFTTSPPSSYIASDHSYKSYPTVIPIPEPSLFSSGSPVYGTVGRKIRNSSRPVSGGSFTNRNSHEEVYSYVGDRGWTHNDKENKPKLYIFRLTVIY